MEKEIPNTKLITEWPFKDLKYKCDLIEYDGPILVFYTDGASKNAMYFWADADTNHNRWLCFQILTVYAILYLTGKITLRECVWRSDYCVLTDIDRKVVYSNYREVIPPNIPEDYLPEENTYYQIEHSDEVKQLLIDLQIKINQPQQEETKKV